MAMLDRFLVALALAAAPLAAFGQAFPDRPVRVVVVDPPGSAVDVVTRLVSDQLTTHLKQPVVIENRPGASGTIAANIVAQSKPDGHTLFMTGTFTEAIVPFAMEKMPYDYRTALVPVSEVARLPFVLVVPGTSKLTTMGEVAAYAKGKAGGLTVGGLPRGSGLHLTWETIAERMGIPSTYVAYNSSNQLQTDLVSGNFDIAIDTIGSARGFIQAGRTRGMAMTSSVRSLALPGVPTLGESGVSGLEVIVWVGMLAPAGTPADRMAVLEKAMIESARAEPVRAKLQEIGYIVTGRTGAEMAETIRQDRQRFEPLVKRLGIKMN
jgi:tripartite-type tricarboxylate transporter receptor subunit TctC